MNYDEEVLKLGLSESEMTAQVEAYISARTQNKYMTGKSVKEFVPMNQWILERVVPPLDVETRLAPIETEPIPEVEVELAPVNGFFSNLFGHKKEKEKEEPKKEKEEKKPGLLARAKKFLFSKESALLDDTRAGIGMLRRQLVSALPGFDEKQEMDHDDPLIDFYKRTPLSTDGPLTSASKDFTPMESEPSSVSDDGGLQIVTPDGVKTAVLKSYPDTAVFENEDVTVYIQSFDVEGILENKDFFINASIHVPFKLQFPLLNTISINADTLDCHVTCKLLEPNLNVYSIYITEQVVIAQNPNIIFQQGDRTNVYVLMEFTDTVLRRVSVLTIHYFGELAILKLPLIHSDENAYEEALQYTKSSPEQMDSGMVDIFAAASARFSLFGNTDKATLLKSWVLLDAGDFKEVGELIATNSLNKEFTSAPLTVQSINVERTGSNKTLGFLKSSERFFKKNHAILTLWTHEDIKVLEIPHHVLSELTMDSFFNKDKRGRAILSPSELKTIRINIQLGEHTEEAGPLLEGMPRSIFLSLDLTQASGVEEMLKSQYEAYFGNTVSEKINRHYPENASQVHPSLVVVQRKWDTQEADLGTIGSVFVAFFQ